MSACKQEIEADSLTARYSRVASRSNGREDRLRTKSGPSGQTVSRLSSRGITWPLCNRVGQLMSGCSAGGVARIEVCQFLLADFGHHVPVFQKALAAPEEPGEGEIECRLVLC